MALGGHAPFGNIPLAHSIPCGRMRRRKPCAARRMDGLNHPIEPGSNALRACLASHLIGTRMSVCADTSVLAAAFESFVIIG